MVLGIIRRRAMHVTDLTLDCWAAIDVSVHFKEIQRLRVTELRVKLHGLLIYDK